MAFRRISCCFGLGSTITQCSNSFSTVIIKWFSISFLLSLGMFCHTTQNESTNEDKPNFFFSDLLRFYVWVCLAVWQKERKMKREEYGIFVQSDMSLNWVSWLRQSLSPLHYSLAKVQAQLIFRKTLMYNHSQSTRIRSALLLAHAHFLCTYSKSTDTQTHMHFHICYLPAVGKTESAYILSITTKDEWFF